MQKARFWWRALAALLLLSVVAAACGSDDDEAGDTEQTTTTAGETGVTDATGPAEPVTIRFERVAGILYSLLDQVAQEKGFFEEENLQVEFQDVQSGPVGIQLIVGGRADAGVQPPDLVFKTMADGTPVQIVSAAHKEMAWFIVANSGFESPNQDAGFPEMVEDLRGKNLGVAARGSSTENIFRGLLVAAGLDPDRDVTFVPTGLLPTAVPAVESGTVDLNLSFDPAFKQLADSGAGYVWLELSEVPLFDPWSHTLYFFRADFLEEHPEVGPAFRRALDKALAFVTDDENFDETLEIAERLLGGAYERDFVEQRLEEELPRYGTQVTEEMVDTMNTFLVDSALLSAPIAFDEIVAPEAAEPPAE